MPLSRRFTWVLVTATIAVGTTMVRAQDQRRWAAEHLSEVDADFAFQGEYLGASSVGDPPLWSWQPLGLQVVALGNGRFDAVAYPGGLPGDGWYGGEKIKLSGLRSAGGLHLKGPSLDAVVEGGGRHVTIYTRRGEALGQLAKVYRGSPTLGAPPPFGAEVLFDGTPDTGFENARITPEGWLMVGTQTKRSYRDYTLHVEFRLAYMPYARGQGRSNSGVYLQSRYEVQVLDSFGLEGQNNECGGLYKLRKPDVNMCFPPLSWQTYDIRFTAARFDDAGNKVANARITVWHNGVAVHHNVAVTRKTGSGAPEGPEPLPIKLQDHHNPVVFRNIWIVEHREPAEIVSRSGPRHAWFGEYATSDGRWQRVEYPGGPAKRGYWLW